MLVRPRYPVAAVAVALILTGCSTAATPEATPETSVAPSAAAPSSAFAAPGATLPDAVSGCGLDGADGVQLNAAETSLFLDTKGPREASGVTVQDVSCVLKALEVPKAITSMMKLTTSTAEATNASWAGRDFSWNYDPETHLQLTIVQA
jgi:hypothetical protein